MGTVNNEKEKAFDGKVRNSMFLIIPAIVVGLGSILLLIFSGNENFAGLRFELGRLWENVIQEKQQETAVEKPVIKRKLKPSKEEASIDPESVRKELETTRNILREARKKRKSAQINVSAAPQVQKKPIDMNEVAFDLSSYRPEFKFASMPRLVERLNSSSIILIPEKKKISKFSVGVSMYPAYTYRHLQYRNEHLGTRKLGNQIFGFHQTEAYREEHDAPLLNFGAGVDLYFQISDKLMLESGLGVQTYGEKVRVLRQKDILSPNGISPMAREMAYEEIYFSPESRPEKDRAIPFINTYSYVRIPVYLNYMVYSGKKYDADIQMGGGLDYLINTDAVVYNFDADLYEWTNNPAFHRFRRLNGHATLGLRLRSYFTENAEVFVNPQMQCMLGSVFEKDYPIRQNHYAIGMRFGLRVHL